MDTDQHACMPHIYCAYDVIFEGSAGKNPGTRRRIEQLVEKYYLSLFTLRTGIDIHFTTRVQMSKKVLKEILGVPSVDYIRECWDGYSEKIYDRKATS
jgi:hypothetical protein